MKTQKFFGSKGWCITMEIARSVWVLSMMLFLVYENTEYASLTHLIFTGCSAFASICYFLNAFAVAEKLNADPKYKLLASAGYRNFYHKLKNWGMPIVFLGFVFILKQYPGSMVIFLQTSLVVLLLVAARILNAFVAKKPELVIGEDGEAEYE